MSEDIKHRFGSLRVQQLREGRRAPYKPLLALWSIGRCLADEERLAPYVLTQAKLKELVERFGPNREFAPEVPFVALKNDGVWETDPIPASAIHKGRRPRVPYLVEHNTRGGLLECDFEYLQSNPGVALEIASNLIEQHFKSTLFDAVMAATLGNVLRLSVDNAAIERVNRLKDSYRDPRFRPMVLEAYRERCAVCKMAIYLNENSVALEAAHIKWHSYQGPATVQNGMALCSLHHNLFDEGAFTVLSSNLEVRIAENLQGEGLDQALGQYERRELLWTPALDLQLPNPTYLDWHGKEVFKSPNLL